jgi:hypothetical protein
MRANLLIMRGLILSLSNDEVRISSGERTARLNRG